MTNEVTINWTEEDPRLQYQGRIHGMSQGIQLAVDQHFKHLVMRPIVGNGKPSKSCYMPLPNDPEIVQQVIKFLQQYAEGLDDGEMEPI